MRVVDSGVEIPDSKITREATELVRHHQSEVLFNHSVRVYRFGAMRGIRQNVKVDPELLYVAALAQHTTPGQRDQVIAAYPRGDFKNEFVQIQTRSAMKQPQTTFATVNVEYIECRDATFRTPDVCVRIRNTPWHG